MLTILDVDNLWPDRARDRLIAFMAEQEEVRYVFLQPDAQDWAQAHGAARVEHVAAPERPWGEGERALVSPRRLLELAQLHRPQVIRCGSPLVLPVLVQLAKLRLQPRPVLVGHWFVEEPHAPLRAALGALDPRLERLSEGAAWWWMVQMLRRFDAVFVEDRRTAEGLRDRGVERILWTPRPASTDVDDAEDGSWRACFERELACMAELVELRRRGQRLEPGIHERLMPRALPG